jgi:mono/diheme cytochrome c family protein
MRPVIVIAAVLAAIVLAACGSSSAPAGSASSRSVSTSTSRGVFSVTTGSVSVTTGSASTSAASGPALFKANCSACHSLTGHQSPAKQGGDLVVAHLPRAVELQYAQEMPVRRALNRAQLTTIVDYILAVQRH